MRKILVLILLIGTYAYAQERAPLFDSLDYRAELQLSLSSGEHTPLWLNANKYGLSSLEKTNGYLRGALERPLSCDNGRRWGVGYGLDVAVASLKVRKYIFTWQENWGSLLFKCHPCLYL